MRRSIKVALVAALPIALINLPPTFAIDVGLPADANWFLRFIAGEWVAMHALGLWLVHFDTYYHLLQLDIFLVFLSGYIEWAALLIGGFYAYRGVRHFAQGFSAKRA